MDKIRKLRENPNARRPFFDKDKDEDGKEKFQKRHRKETKVIRYRPDGIMWREYAEALRVVGVDVEANERKTWNRMR